MNKEMVKLLCLIGLTVTAVLASGLTIYWRFSNPDMSETRLFLTYWKEYVAIVTLVCLCYAGVKK